MVRPMMLYGIEAVTVIKKAGDQNGSGGKCCDSHWENTNE